MEKSLEKENSERIFVRVVKVVDVARGCQRIRCHAEELNCSDEDILKYLSLHKDEVPRDESIRVQVGNILLFISLGSVKVGNILLFISLGSVMMYTESLIGG